MAIINCPKCGADVEEKDCLEIDMLDDYIIFRKWGECISCKAEIGWDEFVPNNPIVRNIMVEE